MARRLCWSAFESFDWCLVFNMGDKGWTVLNTIFLCLQFVLLAMSVCFPSYDLLS